VENLSTKQQCKWQCTYVHGMVTSYSHWPLAKSHVVPMLE